MRQTPIEGYREKLLEMTKALFPEYNRQYFAGSERDYVCLYNGPASTSEGICLHFYEFINTWLAEGIFTPNPEKYDRNLKEKMKDFFWSSNMYWYNRNCEEGNEYHCKIIHPIDYLYSIFKEEENKKL